MATEINITSPLMMICSALSSGALILFSHLLTAYQNIHLPPILIEGLQAISYAGAITVSCLTIYKFCKERKKKK